MFLLVGSDLDEDDIKVLKQCIKAAKKKKKKSKKITKNDKDEFQSNSEHLIKSEDRKKTGKRKLEDTQTEGTAHKIKRKNLNSRLERLIKIKNRRHKIPPDSKLSPLFKEKELNWSTIKSGNCLPSENSDSNDSGVGSLGNSVEKSQHLKDMYMSMEKFEYCACLNKNVSCSYTEQSASCGEKGECICELNICTCTTVISCSTNSCDTCYNKIPTPDKIVAMDCEFVGVHPKNTSALGRCSIVDFHGNTLYDKYVRPESPIMTYRTRWSGIRKRDMRQALPFSVAQQQISEIIQDKIVVGHSVFNDFKVLKIQHSGKYIRDTAGYKPLRSLANLSERTTASLKNLSQILLGKSIQQHEHCSIEDSRATLELYKLVRTSWEQTILNKAMKRTQNDVQETNRTEIMSSTDGQSSDLTNDFKTFLSDQYWPQYLFPSDNSNSYIKNM